jgi:V/A-type H+-transporting ATPase subunit A
MPTRFGKVVGVNGNMVAVEFTDHVMQNEVAFVVVGDQKLKAEVIRVKAKRADLQVFEDTDGMKVGDSVEFSGELLSIELGPGLLTQVFDGLQNPLPQLADAHGYFLKRGTYLQALPDHQTWEFTPTLKVGAKVYAGDQLGTVQEKIFKHCIMVPFKLTGLLEVVEICNQGSYAVNAPIAKLKDSLGHLHSVSMKQLWPVKVPIKAYTQKLRAIISQEHIDHDFSLLSVLVDNLELFLRDHSHQGLLELTNDLKNAIREFDITRIDFLVKILRDNLEQ